MHEKEIEKLQAEKEKVERQLAQEQHKIQRLENRAAYYEKGERRKRAHRLITRGAAIESVAPLLAPGTHSHFESGKFSQFWPEPGTNPAQWVRLKTPFRVHPKQPN